MVIGHCTSTAKSREQTAYRYVSHLNKLQEVALRIWIKVILSFLSRKSYCRPDRFFVACSIWGDKSTRKIALINTTLRFCPKTLRSITYFTEHHSDWRQKHKRKSRAVQTFPIFGEPPASSQPYKCALHDPSSRQNREPLSSFVSLYDFSLNRR